MAYNKVILNGTLPHFPANTYNPGTDEKRAFLSWALSVQRDFKKADEQYYQNDLLTFKAFGPTADFIMNYFNQGDGMILDGRLQRDDDYTDSEGNPKKGQMYILVHSVKFVNGKGNGESNGEGEKSSAPSTSKKPPIGSKKPTVPIAPKKPGIKKPF